jgi:hypothetical protein
MDSTITHGEDHPHDLVDVLQSNIPTQKLHTEVNMPEKNDVYCAIGFIIFLLIISWAMLSSIEPTTYQPDGPMPNHHIDSGIGEYAK